MKRLTILIAALSFGITLMAQPFPPTLFGIPVTGSIEALSHQLEYVGFTDFYDTKPAYGGYYKGEKATLHVEMNKEINQILALKLRVTDNIPLEDALKKYEMHYNDFTGDSYYTALRSNKLPTSKADLNNEKAYGTVYTSTFYQNGDPNKLVELNMNRVDYVFYVEIKVTNLYNKGPF